MIFTAISRFTYFPQFVTHQKATRTKKTRLSLTATVKVLNLQTYPQKVSDYEGTPFPSQLPDSEFFDFLSLAIFSVKKWKSKISLQKNQTIFCGFSPRNLRPKWSHRRCEFFGDRKLVAISATGMFFLLFPLFGVLSAHDRVGIVSSTLPLDGTERTVLEILKGNELRGATRHSKGGAAQRYGTLPSTRLPNTTLATRKHYTHIYV